MLLQHKSWHHLAVTNCVEQLKVDVQSSHDGHRHCMSAQMHWWPDQSRHRPSTHFIRHTDGHPVDVDVDIIAGHPVLQFIFAAQRKLTLQYPPLSSAAHTSHRTHTHERAHTHTHTHTLAHRLAQPRPTTASSVVSDTANTADQTAEEPACLFCLTASQPAVCTQWGLWSSVRADPQPFRRLN